MIVAAAFAVMPIEKASTVHTTISTNINTQDRGISWTFEAAAPSTNIVIPAKANLDIIGTATLSTIDGAGTCELQDTGGDVIIAAQTAGNTLVANIDAGTTPVGFAVGEGQSRNSRWHGYVYTNSIYRLHEWINFPPFIFATCLRYARVY